MDLLGIQCMDLLRIRQDNYTPLDFQWICTELLFHKERAHRDLFGQAWDFLV